jgi:hypothetical protein
MVARAAAPKMTRVLWCPVRPNGWELIISSDGSSLLQGSDLRPDRKPALESVSGLDARF